MADYVGIRDAIESLVSLLHATITTSGEPVINGVPVQAGSPRELEVLNISSAVSVWLHRVDVQPDRLNSAPTRPDPDHELRRPIPVELVVQVTPLNQDADTRLTLLGRIVQVLNDHRTLKDADLAGGLVNSGLTLRLALEFLNAYDLHQLWSTQHTDERPGIGVRLLGLSIDSELTPLVSHRVLLADAGIDTALPLPTLAGVGG